MKQLITLLAIMVWLTSLTHAQGIRLHTYDQSEKKVQMDHQFPRRPDVTPSESFQLLFDEDRWRGSRIIGGTNANIEDHPWQVAVTDDFFLICGGSIINEEWVLTAAHCVDDPEEAIRIFSGGDELPSFDQMRAVTEIIIHPDYAMPDNDVALLRLASPLVFDARTSSIPLVTQSDADDGLTDPGVMGQVTGWGATNPDGTGFPGWLQVADVPIRDITDTSFPPSWITPNMILAGDDGYDSCGGDSGGPLTVPDGNGGQKLAGVTSWGYGAVDCGDPDYPGVYARVSYFEDWFESFGIFKDPDAPAAPTNFTATYDSGGPLEVDLNWNNPSQTVAGDPLTALDEVRIYRNELLIHTISSPIPGAAASYTDTGVAEGSGYTYTVVGENVHGEGIPATASVYVGGAFTLPFVEEFDGEMPAYWTAVTHQGNVEWEWTNTGGDYGGQLNSSTAANGYMILNSDLYGSAGVPEEADLISPAIDCSGATGDIFLSVEHLARTFGTADISIYVSNDDFATKTLLYNWSGAPQHEFNGPNPVVSLFNITSVAAGQPNVKVKFKWQGEWDYWWLIDDVHVFEDESFELTVLEPVGEGTVLPAPGTYEFTGGTVVDLSALPGLGYDFHSWSMGNVDDPNSPVTTITMDQDHTVQATFVQGSPLLWTQNWEDPQASTNGIVSSLFGALPDPGYTVSADDFMVPEGKTWEITNVWARGFISFLPLPDGFGFRLYEDAGGEPGTLLHDILVESPNFDPGMAKIDLPEPIEIGEGTYWIAVYGYFESAEGPAEGRWNQYTWNPASGVLGNAMLRDYAEVFGPDDGWFELVDLDPEYAALDFAISGIETDDTEPEYTVSFNETNDLENVLIRVYTDAGHTEQVSTDLFTDAGGGATIDLQDGNYWFTATLAGYETHEGDFTVAGVNKPVNFTMTELPPDTYTVNFQVIGTGGNLTAEVDGMAIASGDMVVEGSDVLFIATPDAGYQVKEWTVNGAVVSAHTAESYTYTDLQQEITVTVEFEEIPPTLYPVNFDVVGAGGSIDAEVDGMAIASGDMMVEGSDVLFIGTPDAGYQVKEWTLDGSVVAEHTGAFYTYNNLDKEITVTVEFEEIPPTLYPVNFNVAGAGGSLFAEVDGMAIASGDPVEEGSDVLFIATPDAGYQVKEWTLDGAVVAGHTAEFYTYNNLDKEITVTVEFEEIPPTLYPVNFNVVGAGGSMDAEVEGMAFASGDPIEEGSNVLFIGTPDAGYMIKEWTLDGSVVAGHTGEFYTYNNLDKEITVTVEFEEIPPTLYPVNFNVVGAGGSMDAEVEGMAIASGDPVEEGSNVLFIGTPDAGYMIKEWTLDGSVVAGHTGEFYTYNNLDKEITVTVEFEEIPPTLYPVNFNVVGAGGSLFAEVDGMAIASGDMVVEGSDVLFIATPDAGYQVKEWTLDGSVVAGHTGEFYTYNNLDKEITVTVEFEEIPPTLYPVNFNVVGAGGSMDAEVDGMAIASGDPVEEGSNVLFIATPDAGYQVKEWTLDGSVLAGHTGEFYTYNNLDQEITVTVEFEEIPPIIYPVNFNVVGAGGSIDAEVDGMAIASGDMVVEGSDVLFIATPDPGYQVKEWTLDGSVVAGHTEEFYTYNNLDKEITVTVEFEEIPPTLYPVNFGVVGAGGSMDAEVDGMAIASGDMVVEGSDVLFTATPDEGYQVLEWTLNGDVLGDHDAHTLMVMGLSESIIVTVDFEEVEEEEPAVDLHIAIEEDVIVVDAECFFTTGTMAVAGGDYVFTIKEGATVNMAAGHSIRFLAGISVESGGYLIAFISDEDICGRPFAREEPVEKDDVIKSIDVTDGSLFFRMYPNPAESEITIEMGRYTEALPLRIEIVNMMGNMVFSEEMPAQQQYRLDLSDRQPGMYVVRVIQGEKTAVERLIIR